MAAKRIRISMTSFADFAVCDPLGQLAKVRQIHRQYETEYFPGADFWSRFVEGVESVLEDGGNAQNLEAIHQTAKHNRGKQYASACKGFKHFWGRHELRLLGHPKVAMWDCGRLQVRVNPEWLVAFDGRPMILKLHTKEKLVLSQRLANPLLHMLIQEFGKGDGSPAVAILDVHRGKLWLPTRSRQDFEPVLRMQAAAFIAGWDVLDAGQSAA